MEKKMEFGREMEITPSVPSDGSITIRRSPLNGWMVECDRNEMGVRGSWAAFSNATDLYEYIGKVLAYTTAPED